MALFPEEAEARAFNDLEALRTWVGLNADALTAVAACTGDLAGSIRNLALIPDSVFRAAVTAARIPGSADPPVPRPLWPVANRAACLPTSTMGTIIFKR